MTTDLEHNRRILRITCRAGHLLGLVMIVMALFEMTIAPWLSRQKLENTTTRIFLEDGLFNLIFPALIVWIVVQFIRYLVEDNYQPGWILRHGHLILYSIALLRILRLVIAVFITSNVAVSYPLETLLSAPANLAPALIWLGLGLVLRLALPIIAESKTLA